MSESKAPFEHTHSLGEVPLVEGEQAEAEIRNDTADRVIDGLGNLEPFCANSEALGECPDLGQALDQDDTSVHGGQEHQAKALAEHVTLKIRHTPPGVLDGLTVVAQGVVGLAQLNHCPHL